MGHTRVADASANAPDATAQFLRWVLAIVLLGALCFMLVVRLTTPQETFRYIGPAACAVLALFCAWLVQHGNTRKALQALGLGFWLLAAAASFYLGGVHSPVVVAFPVVIMLIGWAFSVRAAAGAGALTVALLLGLWWAGWTGQLPESPISSTAKFAVMQILLTVVAVLLVNFLCRFYTLRLEEMKGLSAELLASRNLLQTIVDTVPVRVFWKDTDLRYLGCNPAFAQDAGLENVAALVGRRDTELSWHAQAELYTEDDRRVITSGEPKHSYDEQQTTPDGRLIWLRTSKVPLRNGAQETIGLLGIYEDITERKHAELALQASESRARDLAKLLRMLCDNVPDLIWAKDLDNRYLFANKAMCEQLLCATDTNEPLGRDDMFFANRQRALHPEDPQWHTFGELCRDSDPITLQNGKTTPFEEFGNVRGQFLFLDVLKTPFLNDEGAVLGVVGSGRNVTQQKMAQERLKLASLVLERSSEALMITDAQDRIVEVNPAFCAMTGYSREEALGHTPHLLRSGHHRLEFYRQMWAALLADGQWQGEIINRRKDGEIYAEWLTISTLFAEDGSVHRRVALFSNVTEKKKKDEQIWRHANFDMLTDLPNRRMFHDRLRQELLRAQRSGLILVVLFLDLDHFKEVNDTLGHDVGDLLLTQVAQRMVACVRETDTVARLGGDEFTLILTDITDPDSVARIAQDLIDSLSRPFEIGVEVARISASIGIATYPSDATEATDLIHKADQAMYAAKAAGRSRFVPFAALPKA